RGVETARVWSTERLSRRAKGQDLQTWLDVVENQIDSQQYGDALRELKDVMLVYPDSPDEHVLLAEIYEKQKSYDLAVGEYEVALRRRPAAETYVMLARVHRAMNHPALAMRAVEEALKLDPDHAAAKTMKTELQKILPKW